MRPISTEVENISTLEAQMKDSRITPTAAMNAKLESIGTAHLKNAVGGRPGSTSEMSRICENVSGRNSDFSHEVDEEVDIQLKYASYIDASWNKSITSTNGRPTPSSDLDYGKIGGLQEVIEKLSQIQPANLGQAKRISGVTRSLGAIMVYLKKKS